MNKTKLHIVLGYANSGKTTTAWLVYLLLKEMGKVEFFQILHDEYQIAEKTETHEDIIRTFPDEYNTSIKRPYDFCAIVLAGGARVAIFSAGDNALPIDNAFWWIEQVKPDFFVGCCRYHGNSSARRSLNNHEKFYRASHYYVGHENIKYDIEELKAKRIDLAQEIVDKILIQNNEKQDTMKNLMDLTRRLVKIYKVEEINTLSALNIAKGNMISAQDVIHLFKYVCAFNTKEYYVGITGRVREREKEHNATFLVVIDCQSVEKANELEELAKTNGFYTGGATGNGNCEDTTKLYIYKMIPGVTIEG